MNFAFDMLTIFGGLGVASSLASFIMKRMLPLRALAIVANLSFIGFALALMTLAGTDPKAALPGLVMNVILLPINIRRVWEISTLTRELTRANDNSQVSHWLLPRMTRRPFAVGPIVFQKGVPADRLIYISRGELVLADVGARRGAQEQFGAEKRLGPGELLGEIGLFSPDRRRTQSLVAKTDGELYELSDEMLFQICYQQPQIGFKLMRLITARLLRDVQRQQQLPSARPA